MRIKLIIRVTQRQFKQILRIPGMKLWIVNQYLRPFDILISWAYNLNSHCETLFQTQAANLKCQPTNLIPVLRRSRGP
jgi:hypothetical protein